MRQIQHGYWVSAFSHNTICSVERSSIHSKHESEFKALSLNHSSETGAHQEVFRSEDKESAEAGVELAAMKLHFHIFTCMMALYSL